MQYSVDELKEKFRARLQTVESTEIPIHRLCQYAMMNSKNYDIFMEELQSLYTTDYAENREKQMACIFLVNEIMHKERERPEVIAMFKPLLEGMMIIAGQTKEESHINRAKHVLDVLCRHEILDQKYADHVREVMDMHGLDDEAGVLYRFQTLNNQLMRIKQEKMDFLKHNPDNEEGKNELIQAEISIREQLVQFYAKNLQEQSMKINVLEKTKKKMKDPMLDALGGSDDSDDSDMSVL